MLSPKRLSESSSDPAVPQNAAAQKIARCFPVIWSALLLATVLMASLIYATLQTPHAANGHTLPLLSQFAAASIMPETSLTFAGGDLVCASASAAEVVVRSTPSDAGIALFTARPTNLARVIAPRTFNANGIAWIGVSIEGHSGYVPERSLNPCASGQRRAL